MTMGPGDHPFFRFGHNAIWIRDTAARTDRVYNFGTFRFDSPRLILDFLGGRLNYWLSVSPLTRVIADYTRENRSVAVQELKLSPEKKAALRDGAGGQRPAGEPPLQIRLLPRQLLDARARRRRSGRRRAPAGERRRAGPPDPARVTRCA